MKLVSQVFLLSILFTLAISTMAFPIIMGFLLYYFPEEWVDGMYLIFTAGLWLLIFLIMYIVVKREKD